MKKSVAITISDEKLAALEMYLEQKNIKLSDESRETPRLPKRKSSLSSNSPQFAPNVQAIASDSCVWRSKAVGGVSLP